MCGGTFHATTAAKIFAVYQFSLVSSFLPSTFGLSAPINLVVALVLSSLVLATSAGLGAFTSSSSPIPHREVLR
ncbi:unnamed protein product, partial [Mesorhabditis belari]|uniref:Uncharacterized protein n=1 Tax=Mesorhabditis belari TaxID=2138241 RepID=A0AAF3F8G3_9BILA